MRRMRSAVSAAASVMLLVSGVALAQFRTTPPDFVAPLSGVQEVPMRDTSATGQAQFRLINLGDTIVYRLIVDDIHNVVAAHIHIAPKGVNGQVVAFLAGPFAPGGGLSTGQIAEGIIEKTNLTGPLQGQPLSALIEMMKSGGAYVNVHTNDGMNPVDTGPGDYPGGEIRGQIQKARYHNPNLTPSGDEPL